MTVNTQPTIIRVMASMVLLLSITATAQAQDLTSMLTDQLGVSNEQATGGAGAIFDYAKNNLGAADFSSIAKGVPDMDNLLSAAPKQDSGSALGKASSLLGGGDSGLGGLASLASSFDSLGLDAGMVSQFLPIVEKYVGSVSGDQAMGLLKGLF